MAIGRRLCGQRHIPALGCIPRGVIRFRDSNRIDNKTKARTVAGCWFLLLRSARNHNGGIVAAVPSQQVAAAGD